MYRFSRAIYRELADEIIEDPHGVARKTNHERVLRACEAAVERLATDRHYFAQPARTLFNDIRAYFPMTLAAARAARDPALSGARRRVPAPPAAERLRRLRQPAAVPRQHPQGHAVPADAAAAQRLLPVASAPRRDRGDAGAARRLSRMRTALTRPRRRGAGGLRVASRHAPRRRRRRHVHRRRARVRRAGRHRQGADHARGPVRGRDRRGRGRAREGRRARPSEVEEFSHGMTVATNALLEGRGARTAFVATEGFTDLIALGRQDRAELYRLCAARPAPLVARRAALRRARADDARTVRCASSTGDAAAELAERGRRGRARGGRGRAAALLPPPRARAARSREALAASLPDAHVSLSHEVVGTFREFERAATTEIDAALSPLLRQLPAPAGRQRARGGHARARDHAVQRRPDRPRGRRRARRLDRAVRPGRRRRRRRVRRPRGRRAERAVLRHGRHLVRRVRGRRRRGAGAQRAARSPGGRWRCRCSRSTPSAPAAARSPGATRGGALRVGPRSAGADPGPACYGRGGTEPTVTDANLVLGYCPPTRRWPAASSSTSTRPQARGRAARRRARPRTRRRAPRGSGASPTPRWSARCAW